MSDLESLADKADITDVVNRYAEGVRLGDVDLILSCFADEATLDYGHHGQVEGTANIRQFFLAGRSVSAPTSGAPQVLDERIGSTPVMGNVTIALRGDYAHCESMCLAIHFGVAAGEGSVVVRGTRNEDDLVRTGAGWRIRKRVHETLWSFQVPGTLNR
jgi:hypothetical protein